ncbi:MAG: phosphatidylserine decarboxylase [Caloramator sp.]|nr:phosphatidylserine decarboxylase [Caloramator sp.]
MIRFYNRTTKQYEIENVAGLNCLKWIYYSNIGKRMLHFFIKRKIASQIYGLYCNLSISRKMICDFVEKFNIDMSRFEKEEYRNFNDFFSRRLNKEKINIEKDDNILISPCDSKVLAYQNIDKDMLIQIKGMMYSLSDLIKNKEIAKQYHGGTCLVFRLSPTDYHRFHFIDEGFCEKTNFIKGLYYSVNPIALKNIESVFCENKRQWSIFHSKNFSNVLYVEIGATFVGSIIQTYTPNLKVSRGDEKGYFKFGGSTVILFIKKEIVEIDEDIIEHTQKGIETSVFMGERIGIKKNNRG